MNDILKDISSGDLQDELDRREEEASIHPKTHEWCKFFEGKDITFLRINYKKSDGISGGEFVLHIKIDSYGILKEINELTVCGIYAQNSLWSADDGGHSRTIEYSKLESTIRIDTRDLESIELIDEQEFNSYYRTCKQNAMQWN